MLMKKIKMTLAEQLEGVDPNYTSSMLYLLDRCSNLHFLTLALLVSTENINVIYKVLERKRLHPLVHRVLLKVVPECMHEMIKSRKDYKPFTANDFLFGCGDTYSESLKKGCWVYTPTCSVTSAEWMQEFYEKKDDIFWLDALVSGQSLPHIIYMLENCEVPSSVLNRVIAMYIADEDAELSLYLEKEVPMREYIHELKPGVELLPTIHETCDNCVVEYDIHDKELLSRLANGEIQIVREFVSEVKDKVWADFCAEREDVFKTIKNHQKIHPFTDMYICWFYFSGNMDLETLKIFYDVEEKFPDCFEWLMSDMTYTDD